MRFELSAWGVQQVSWPLTINSLSCSLALFFCHHSFSNSRHQHDVVRRIGYVITVIFTISCLICVLWPVTSDFSKWIVSYTPCIWHNQGVANPSDFVSATNQTHNSSNVLFSTDALLWTSLHMPPLLVTFYNMLEEALGLSFPAGL